MLIFASWSEKFRAAIGLKGASQVWGPRPAWYIWLENAPGVYHLELINAGTNEVKRKPFCTALFTIKCYPYQHSDHFQTFSFIEQKLIKSHFFDETHTPAFEHQDKIPPHLFNISTLELTVDHDDAEVLFCFETLERLRSRYSQKTNETYSSLSIDKKFKKGEIDRNISGLEIGNPLFDCLLCLFSNASKRTPLQVQCSRFAGFEIRLQCGEPKVKRSDRIKGYRLRALYASSNNCQAPALMKMQNHGGKSREDIFYDRKFTDGHFHNHAGKEYLPITVNPQWWQMAKTQYESELASACGCH